MINASTLSGAKSKRSSSNDTRAVHPYVIAERIRMVLEGEKANWTTSKIIRKKNKNTGETKISIKIITK